MHTDLQYVGTLTEELCHWMAESGLLTSKVAHVSLYEAGSKFGRCFPPILLGRWKKSPFNGL